jgi:flavin reductase (DIM6/NTAB) family NADH-FMN oxidoreductase RutF
MKKQIKTTEAIFPMPVLLISTFNEDGTVDVMNAAWGTMLERDMVALNLTETHKTVENIRRQRLRHSHCDAKQSRSRLVRRCQWAQGPDKFEKSGMSLVTSEMVDAPIINELPVAIECEFGGVSERRHRWGVIGKGCGLLSRKQSQKRARSISIRWKRSLSILTHVIIRSAAVSARHFRTA